MKFTGRLKEPIIDYISGKTTALIELNEDFREAYEELKGCDKLSLEIKRYRGKRSLDANAYYWLLLTKLAERIGLSNAAAHNMILRGYGQYETIAGQCVYMDIIDTDEAEQRVNESDVYHLKPTSDVRVDEDGSCYRSYIMLRGSKGYDSREMARLINGLVEQCMEAGIPKAEIASPEETRILKERYGIDIGQEVKKRIY